MISVSTARLVKELFSTLERLESGTLHVETPKGTVKTYRGDAPGAEAYFKVNDWEFLQDTVRRGDIGLGESYIDGKWDTDNIERLFTVLLSNMNTFERYEKEGRLYRALYLIMHRVMRANSKKGSRQNIEAHYDVGNAFYRLWLDDTMTYSSAIFEQNAEPLEKAQKRKYQRMLSRAGQDGYNLLEIGCGWGGFAEEAAYHDFNVKALTISPAQHEYASQRLNGRANIALQDYRDERGKYNGIVSIEMFEAVGESYWKSYFETLKRSLKESGHAMIQTITIDDALFDYYRKSSDFIRHYTFPGGMLPSVKRFRKEAERVGLKVRDVFHFGHDYAETLRQWSMRFHECEKKILSMGYDEQFIRNWRYYLGICAASFAVGRTDVVQVELVHA